MSREGESFLRQIAGNTIGGVLATLVLAVLSLLLGLLLRNIRLGIYLTSFILIGACFIIMWQRKSRAWTIVTAAMVLSIVILAFFVIRRPPWCGIEPTRLSVEHGQTGQQLLIERDQTVYGEPDTMYVVHADTFVEGFRSNAISCDWSYIGDGRILQVSRCQMLLRTGTDEDGDLVRVATTVLDCPQALHYGFFITTLQDGQ